MGAGRMASMEENWYFGHRCDNPIYHCQLFHWYEQATFFYDEEKAEICSVPRGNGDSYWIVWNFTGKSNSIQFFTDEMKARLTVQYMTSSLRLPGPGSRSCRYVVKRDDKEVECIVYMFKLRAGYPAQFVNPRARIAFL